MQLSFSCSGFTATLKHFLHSFQFYSYFSVIISQIVFCTNISLVNWRSPDKSIQMSMEKEKMCSACQCVCVRESVHTRGGHGNQGTEIAKAGRGHVIGTCGIQGSLWQGKAFHLYFSPLKINVCLLNIVILQYEIKAKLILGCDTGSGKL